MTESPDNAPRPYEARAPERTPDLLAWSHERGIIPPNLMDGFRDWLHHATCGGFIRAVIENDFVNAIANADADSLECIHAVMLFVANFLPSTCWGSKAKARAWEALAQEERDRIAAEWDPSDWRFAERKTLPEWDVASPAETAPAPKVRVAPAAAAPHRDPEAVGVYTSAIEAQTPHGLVRLAVVVQVSRLHADERLGPDGLDSPWRVMRASLAWGFWVAVMDHINSCSRLGDFTVGFEATSILTYARVAFSAAGNVTLSGPWAEEPDAISRLMTEVARSIREWTRPGGASLSERVENRAAAEGMAGVVDELSKAGDERMPWSCPVTIPDDAPAPGECKCCGERHPPKKEESHAERPSSPEKAPPPGETPPGG